MGSLKNTIRALKNQVGQNYVTLKLHDGSTVQFPEDSWKENFGRNADRLNAYYRGEPIPDPHPFGVALLSARNLGEFLAKAAESQRVLENYLEKGRLHMG